MNEKKEKGKVVEFPGSKAVLAAPVNEEVVETFKLDAEERIALITGISQVDNLTLRKQLMEYELNQAQAKLNNLSRTIQGKHRVNFQDYTIDLVNNVITKKGGVS